MSNPRIPQGEINRLLSSVTFQQNAALNLIPAFLAEDMIRLSFEGEVTRFINTATGIVVSPQPFILCTVTLDILKTLSIAWAWKAQIESNSLLGSAVVRLDTDDFPEYDLANVAIANQDEIDISGRSASFRMRLRGQYYINSDLWP